MPTQFAPRVKNAARQKKEYFGVVHPLQIQSRVSYSLLLCLLSSGAFEEIVPLWVFSPDCRLNYTRALVWTRIPSSVVVGPLG